MSRTGRITPFKSICHNSPLTAPWWILLLLILLHLSQVIANVDHHKFSINNYFLANQYKKLSVLLITSSIHSICSVNSIVQPSPMLWMFPPTLKINVFAAIHIFCSVMSFNVAKTVMRFLTVLWSGISACVTKDIIGHSLLIIVRE